MAVERTLSIIKPDAVAKNAIGAIIARFEKEALNIAAMQMKWLSQSEAKRFYYIHRERPFFGELVSYMVSGPVVIMVLEGENAVAKNREVMGATDPKKAETGTIRAEFGTDISANAIHGSDSLENAAQEIAFFFPQCTIFQRCKIS